MIWNALKNSAVAIFWVYIVFLSIYALFLLFFFRRKSILEVKIERHKVSWHERETERDDEHLQTIPEADLDNPNAPHHQK
jgi:Ca2+/Na+ antiporter